MTYQKPRAIDNYNHEMGGIDVMDQTIHSYDCCRKSYSWFKKIDLNCIMRLIFNSWILYRRFENKVSYLDVLKQTVQLLTGLKSTPRVTRGRRSSGAGVQTGVQHVHERIPPTENKMYPMKKSVVFASSGKSLDITASDVMTNQAFAWENVSVFITTVRFQENFET